MNDYLKRSMMKIEPFINPPYSQHEYIKHLADLMKERQQEEREQIIMTRQDFVEIASVLEKMNHVPEEFRKQMALAFIHFFQSKNPNFDEVRFMTACNFSQKD